MTDSVATVESSRDAASVESAIQSWLDGNAVTSVDDIEIYRRGSNKMVAVIAYTA